MSPISIEKFAKQFVKDNPNFVEDNKNEALQSVLARLKEAVSRKKAGQECMICGQPIWAIGSAIVGSDMCFTCITGEADHSDDYEIDE